MNKWGRGPISLKRTLQAIRPELISNVLNGLKGDGSSGGEGGRIGANGHTEGRICSCQTCVRKGVKENGEKSLTCD